MMVGIAMRRLRHYPWAVRLRQRKGVKAARKEPPSAFMGTLASHDWVVFQGGVNLAFDHVAGFACALLDAPDQFVVFTFLVAKVVIRKLCPLLLELTLRHVPITLYS